MLCCFLCRNSQYVNYTIDFLIKVKIGQHIGCAVKFNRFKMNRCRYNYGPPCIYIYTEHNSSYFYEIVQTLDLSAHDPYAAQKHLEAAEFCKMKFCSPTVKAGNDTFCVLERKSFMCGVSFSASYDQFLVERTDRNRKEHNIE